MKKFFQRISQCFIPGSWEIVSWTRLLCVRSLLAFSSPKILRSKTGRQHIAIWRTSSWKDAQLWFFYMIVHLCLSVLFFSKLSHMEKSFPHLSRHNCYHLLKAMGYLWFLVGWLVGCFFMRGYNYRNPSSIFLLVFTIDFGQFNLFS